MFQRGQKIIILESSAGKRTHPRAGDIGYLDNMYLFINDRFILLDAFFFQYAIDNKQNKDRVEKKRFIIDLGMQKNLKFNISNGVPIKFFVNKYHINLTSTGYVVGVSNDIGNLIEYPLIHSNYGIWNSLRRSTKDNSANIHLSKKLYKIPYGHITLFSNKYNSKYRIGERSGNEFIAWIRSMMPVISSMLGVFYNYKEGIKLTHGRNYLSGAIDDCFAKSNVESKTLRKYIKHIYASTYKLKTLSVGNQEHMMSGYHISKDIEKLDKFEKSVIIKNVNFINSLNNIFIQRLDAHHINTFNHKSYKDIRDYIRNTWGTEGMLSKSIAISEIMPVVDIVKSILCRAIITRCNTKEKLGLISTNYLPMQWIISLEKKIGIIEEMRLEAGNNSSALNRIYDILTPKPTE